MTLFTKCLLAGSLTGLLLGVGTSLLGNIALPLGAVCFGLFLISKMLEHETALYDEEQQKKMALAERSANRESSERERGMLRHELTADTIP